jgi:hypothetical protein
VCQHSAFIIAGSLIDRHPRLDDVTRSALALCSILAGAAPLAVGIFGRYAGQYFEQFE